MNELNSTLAPLFETEMDVRWRDLDAYDHVNNSVFLTLIEEARIRWFETLPGPWRSLEAEPVLARTEVNYRSPIRHPARVRVLLRLQRVGRSSLTLSHELVDASTAQLYSDGLAVLVWVSPEHGRPVDLPAAVRGAVG